MNLAGRTALVTGATGGIGQAIARGARAAGASVVLSGRRTDVLEPLAQELGAKAIAADLADRDEVLRLAAAAGDVDVLVANAGLSVPDRLTAYDVDEVEQALDVNLGAPILLDARAAAADDRARQRASRLHLVGLRQGRDAGTALLGDEVRAARLRAGAAQEPPRERRRRERRLPRVHPRRRDVPRRGRRAARLRRHELAGGRRRGRDATRSSAIAARSTSPRSRCASASSSASSRPRAPRG